MSKEVITHGEARSILILFIMGSTLILGTGLQAGKDLWLAILLALGMAIPAILMYARLLDLYPGQDLFDILHTVFGKILGKLVSLVYIWYALHLGALVLRNFGSFMKAVAMPETPIIIPMLFLGVLGIMLVMSGIETMGRSSRLLLNLCLGTIIIVILLILGILDFQNMLPVLDKGWGRIWQGAFSTFSFPFAETVLCTAVFSSLKGNKSAVRVFLYGLLIGGAIVLLIAIRNVSAVGEDVLANTYFPSYLAVSRVDAGDFIQRIEGTVALVFVIAVFIKMSVCLLAASKGIGKLFGLHSYRSVVIQTGLLIIYLAYIVYGNIMEMEYWAIHIYKFYAFPFQVIIPVILLAVAEIKVRRSRKAPKKA